MCYLGGQQATKVEHTLPWGLLYSKEQARNRVRETDQETKGEGKERGRERGRAVCLDSETREPQCSTRGLRRGSPHSMNNYSTGWWENIRGLVFISYKKKPKKTKAYHAEIWPASFVICHLLSWILWFCLMIRLRICRGPESLTRIWKQTASLTFDKRREEVFPFSMMYHFLTAAKNADIFQITEGSVWRLKECVFNDHWMSNDYRYACAWSTGILVVSLPNSLTFTQNHPSIITLKKTFWGITLIGCLVQLVPLSCQGNYYEVSSHSWLAWLKDWERGKTPTECQVFCIECLHMKSMQIDPNLHLFLSGYKNDANKEIYFIHYNS